MKSFLIWRQKEFVEKYEGTRHNTEDDNYNALEGELESGKPMLALINADLMDWDSKASHPWLTNIEINFKAEKNGMPDDASYQLLNEIEEKIIEQLKDSDGYLNVGRETASGNRNIYLMCREFRKPSKVLSQIQAQYSSQLKIKFDIYKDKYWRSLIRFANTIE